MGEKRNRRAAETHRLALQRELAQPQPGLVREFAGFLRTHKKWWLLPILLSLLVVSLFVYVALSPVAPLVYPF